eukprot:4332890-Prymnesium_polylepis.1
MLPPMSIAQLLASGQPVADAPPEHAAAAAAALALALAGGGGVPNGDPTATGAAYQRQCALPLMRGGARWPARGGAVAEATGAVVEKLGGARRRRTAAAPCRRARRGGGGRRQLGGG